MYSVLPAVVSAVFLGYGLYVLAVKGLTRVSASFFLLCLTTFFWQGTWAVLFQLRDPHFANILVRFGYLLILFLPTTLYHFLVEISEQDGEHRWVYLSYAAASVLGFFDVGSNLFVAGHYDYFWGPYPKAGPLHPIHVLQTVLVVNRGLYITWREAQVASHDRRMRLRLCVASLLIYFFAAVDYLCNYGLEFYPPGVVFVAISLGLIVVAVTRYSLMDPMTIAATVAHEMRTPLASIRMQAEALAQWMPEMHRGYQLALAHGLIEPAAHAPDPERLNAASQAIAHQVDRSNAVIDMVLASSRMERIDTADFAACRMGDCVREAVETYPFKGRDRQRVHVRVKDDFEFRGSQALMVFVLFNLIKNSIYAIQASGRGDIFIEVCDQRLVFKDTGPGIAPAVLQRMFEPFYTTKKAQGAGIGLAFCQRTVHSFGGNIACSSVEGQHTTFTLTFPPPAQLIPLD
jgi:two-component system, CAI-1 autoinducer sensor kinase/phosphatase CqsS